MKFDGNFTVPLWHMCRYGTSQSGTSHYGTSQSGTVPKWHRPTPNGLWLVAGNFAHPLWFVENHFWFGKALWLQFSPSPLVEPFFLFWAPLARIPSAMPHRLLIKRSVPHWLLACARCSNSAQWPLAHKRVLSH